MNDPLTAERKFRENTGCSVECGIFSFFFEFEFEFEFKFESVCYFEFEFDFQLKFGFEYDFVFFSTMGLKTTKFRHLL